MRQIGKTRKGVNWGNYSPNLHWENCMQSVREKALPYLRGDNGADLCCGIEKIKDECWGIDSGEQFGDKTDADEIRDCTDLAGYSSRKFDWVFSSNGLEHIEQWKYALSEWVRVLRMFGTIYLYLPWPEKEPMWAAENDKNDGAKKHRWNPSPDIVQQELERLGVVVIDCDKAPDAWGAFSIVGVKTC